METRCTFPPLPRKGNSTNTELTSDAGFNGLMKWCLRCIAWSSVLNSTFEYLCLMSFGIYNYICIYIKLTHVHFFFQFSILLKSLRWFYIAALVAEAGTPYRNFPMPHIVDSCLVENNRDAFIRWPSLTLISSLVCRLHWVQFISPLCLLFSLNAELEQACSLVAAYKHIIRLSVITWTSSWSSQINWFCDLESTVIVNLMPQSVNSGKESNNFLISWLFPVLPWMITVFNVCLMFYYCL